MDVSNLKQDLLADFINDDDFVSASGDKKSRNQSVTSLHDGATPINSALLTTFLLINTMIGNAFFVFVLRINIISLRFRCFLYRRFRYFKSTICV